MRSFLTALLLVIFSVGGVMAEEKLSPKQEAIVEIAAFTSRSDMDGLKGALNKGLDNGLTVNEIKEILTQLYAYCGFPRSLNAIHNFMDVMEDRSARGIQDPEGKAASPLPENWDRNAYGAKTRAKIWRQAQIPPPAGYQVFVPAIDQFLKEHLFADIFARDALDWESRELATISALASVDGLGGQLRAHMNGAMNVGLTPGQMREFVVIIGDKAGKKEGDAAAVILEEVLKARAASK